MKLHRSLMLAAAAAVPFVLAAAPLSAADNPFAALDGAWGGTGSVRLDERQDRALEVQGLL